MGQLRTQKGAIFLSAGTTGWPPRIAPRSCRETACQLRILASYKAYHPRIVDLLNQIFKGVPDVPLVWSQIICEILQSSAMNASGLDLTDSFESVGQLSSSSQLLW